MTGLKGRLKDVIMQNKANFKILSGSKWVRTKDNLSWISSTLLGCEAKFASQGGTNLWQNLQMTTIKSGLEFRMVPTVTVGADMCLGGFR